jgi:hypothetical protein
MYKLDVNIKIQNKRLCEHTYIHTYAHRHIHVRRSIGILNLEWAVLLRKSNKDVIPDEATTSTILPCPRRQDRSVVQTNVLSVPPLPYTKNSFPSLFVMIFKIVSYVLR